MKNTHAAASDQKHPATTNARGHVFNQFFSRFAHTAARAAGSPTAFLIATTFIILWAVTGPAFGYSDTWQLVINTATTIITFLMVFLIQNTQNRDSLALQAKLAELIIAMKGAENRIATVEDLSEEELEQLHQDLCARAEATSDVLNVRRGKKKHVPKDAANPSPP
jgi:low affinity Fe/Cu permease